MIQTGEPENTFLPPCSLRCRKQTADGQTFTKRFGTALVPLPPFAHGPALCQGRRRVRADGEPSLLKARCRGPWPGYCWPNMTWAKNRSHLLAWLSFPASARLSEGKKGSEASNVKSHSDNKTQRSALEQLASLGVCVCV